MKTLTRVVVSTFLILFLAAILGLAGPVVRAAEESGSVGIEGTVPGNPPTQAPTITIPRNGQVFTSIPITVSGLCQSGLLVEVFKNNVFAGSANCINGSFSMQIDLFSGRNDLTARLYDALDQAGPDSATVTVTFNDTIAQSSPRISLISAYAKRGANPGSTLTWPLVVTGGQPPYAISVDWGDKTEPDLLTQLIAGEFNVEHIYKQAGVYNVIIKATDADGVAAFLQVVGIGNGPIQQSTATTGGGTNVVVKESIPLAFWVTAALALPLLILSFWLGKRHQLQNIRVRLRKGERPL